MPEKYVTVYNNLRKDWQDFNADPKNKKIRIRDVADILSTNEASLLSTKINDGVIFLSFPDVNAFLKELSVSGRLMFLVRNDFVVHEKNICSKDLIFSNNIIFDKNQDEKCLIEFNSKEIAYTFYESKMHRDRLLESFQFFDIHGQSIMKVYLKEDDSNSFKEIASNYNIQYNYELQKNILNKKNLVISSNSIENIRMPFKFNVNNIVKYIVDDNIVHSLLGRFSKNKIKIQVHINGNSVVQYHRGLISNIVQFGDWINVLDKEFNLHAIEKNINNIIVYEYKNVDKSDYSIEFFDENNIHLMGFAPLIKYDHDFEKIINSLGVFDE